MGENESIFEDFNGKLFTKLILLSKIYLKIFYKFFVPEAVEKFLIVFLFEEIFYSIPLKSFTNMKGSYGKSADTQLSAS